MIPGRFIGFDTLWWMTNRRPWFRLQQRPRRTMAIMNRSRHFFDLILIVKELGNSGAGAVAIWSKLLNWIRWWMNAMETKDESNTHSFQRYEHRRLMCHQPGPWSIWRRTCVWRLVSQARVTPYLVHTALRRFRLFLAPLMTMNPSASIPDQPAILPLRATPPLPRLTSILWALPLARHHLSPLCARLTARCSAQCATKISPIPRDIRTASLTWDDICVSNMAIGPSQHAPSRDAGRSSNVQML